MKRIVLTLVLMLVVLIVAVSPSLGQGMSRVNEFPVSEPCRAASSEQAEPIDFQPSVDEKEGVTCKLIVTPPAK